LIPTNWYQSIEVGCRNDEWINHAIPVASTHQGENNKVSLEAAGVLFFFFRKSILSTFIK
jgi:hypothetical protein